MSEVPKHKDQRHSWGKGASGVAGTDSRVEATTLMF
jgi:hypothetical protein